MTELKLGESVKVIVDYDLFELNIKGKIGIAVSHSDSNNKYLVYFEENGEWAELLETEFKQVSPGKVPRKNKKFLSTVRRMECTY